MPLRWQTSYVAVWVGWNEPPSLAFNAAGTPAIACYASLSTQLNFYEPDDGGFWLARPIDAQVNNSGDVSCSLAFRHNQPAVSYAVSGDELRFARRRGALAFDVHHIGDAAWARTSLAYTPAGRPAIACVGPGRQGIRYAVAGDNETVWTSSVVDADAVGWYVSLAFTPDGRPAIAYTDGGVFDQTWQIKYAVFDGTRWVIETVAQGDDSPVLGFDSTGRPMVVYGVRQPMAIMCASRGPAAWHISKVVDYGYSPSLAFTPAGDPAIAYVDLVYHAAVKYAVRRNGGWTHHIVDAPVKQQAAAQGWYFWFTPSLAFNPVSGEPAIAYYQYDTAAIKYAVGRTRPGGLADVVSDLVTALARRLARPPRPPAPAPPARTLRTARTARTPRAV